MDQYRPLYFAFHGRAYGLRYVFLPTGQKARPDRCRLSASVTLFNQGCIFIYITAAAPNKRSLGATNGLAFTIVSAVRILAPLTATSLYSFSVEHNLLGGYAVYIVLTLLSCFAVLFALLLPDDVRPAWEIQKEE